VHALARRAAALGMHALALTDHNTLAGVMPFCDACKVAGVKPIIGCELDLQPLDSKVPTDVVFRIVVLVESEPGYRNLAALVSCAHSSVKHGKPSVRADDLREHSAGLIALTGGSSSELYHLLETGRLNETEAHVTQLARIFGRENLVFEIQDHGRPRQRSVNDKINGLCDFLAMRCVATNDVHYLSPPDRVCLEFLKSEPAPSFLDFHDLKNGAHTRHLATSDEMRTRFHKYPRALYTTAEIADRCQFQVNTEKKRFPVHDFVRGFDADSFLWDLTFREARAKYAELGPEMKTRLNQEFDFIKSDGLSNNILLLWNIAQHCRKNRISLGVGRGNMVSSFVAYILGITQINPLDYRLRFLGFGDGAAHDRCLSIEVPRKHTRAVQDFLRETFGADFCSAVARFQWCQRPALVREICAWFGVPARKMEATLADGDAGEPGKDAEFEKFFPKRIEGIPVPSPEIVRFMVSRLMPRPRTMTVSENQFAISGENLGNLVPRVMVDEEEVAQMDPESLDMLNIPRLTIESNTVLNILDAAAGWVRREENAAFDPDRIPMDDEETYGLLCRGLTNGIDPFHSITLKSLLRMHQPRNFMGLVKIKSMEHSPDKEHEADVREHVPECLLTYRCAFVKAHYPIGFMAALLTHTYRKRKKFTVILREAKQMGLKILPPDINQSLFDFSQVHKAIRTGLAVVNGMGEKAYAEIARVRKGGDFNDLLDLCRRTDARLINNRLLGNLVKTGTLDSFGLRRSQMLQMIEEGIELARDSGSGPTLFDDQPDRNALSAVEPPEIPELPLHEIIRHEIAAAGYCISHDQLHLYKDLIRQCRALSPHELTRRMVGREVHVAGFLDHVEHDSPLIDQGEQVLLDLEGHVVTMPVKASRLYQLALSANAPVLVGGTVHRRKDEVYVKALTAFTLRMVQQMSQQVLRLDLDLAGEDFRTLRLIGRLVRQFKGRGPELQVQNTPDTFWPRLVRKQIERAHVFFSPPFYYALKKILPEDRITLVASDEMDPALLHALSPLRFPKVEAETPAETGENSSIVDAY
jgi:DNA polymerase III alpha subunit